MSDEKTHSVDEMKMLYENSRNEMSVHIETANKQVANVMNVYSEDVFVFFRLVKFILCKCIVHLFTKKTLSFAVSLVRQAI